MFVCVCVYPKNKMMNGLRSRKIVLDGNKNQCSSIPSCFMTNKNQFTEYRNHIKEIIINKLNIKFKDVLAGRYNLELRWNGERNMMGNKIGDSWTLMNVPQILGSKVIEELTRLLPNMIIDETDCNSMMIQNASHNTISINFCVELEKITILYSLYSILCKVLSINGLVMLLVLIMAIIGSIDHYVVPRMINYNDPCSYFNYSCKSWICTVINYLSTVINYSCKSCICSLLSGISYNPTFINNCQSHFLNTNII